jgi:hypothetical protein
MSDMQKERVITYCFPRDSQPMENDQVKSAIQEGYRVADIITKKIAGEIIITVFMILQGNMSHSPYIDIHKNAAK